MDGAIVGTRRIEIETPGARMIMTESVSPQAGAGNRVVVARKPVIGPSSGIRILVATQPVDFRRGMNGVGGTSSVSPRRCSVSAGVVLSYDFQAVWSI